jgi:acyl-CoA reductase-like NAD-dependent aldehyde dehydrogenase
MSLESINPFDNSPIRSYEEHTDSEVDGILTEVSSAAVAWRSSAFADRSALLRALATLLRERKAELSSLMTAEMGKLLRSSEAEVEKCAWVCEYYAEKGEGFLSPQAVETDAAKSYVTFNPLGVVLAVMAGNAGVLKHASNVSGCALAIEDLFRSAAAPGHLFRTLLVSGSRVPDLIEDARIAAVTLTGSTEAGRSVGRTAGGAIKKSVLELGGSVPEGKGAFYPPTVLTDVGRGSPAYTEEIFGPVASIITAKDEAEALQIANDSAFGLGAAVFTNDVARGERIAATELSAGHCAVNAFVKSDPRLPFGGIKLSGYGRELSWYGIREFVNIKTVFVA